MICQIHRPSHDYQLRRGVAGSDAVDDDAEILEFYDRYGALQFLRGLAIDPAVTHGLRLFLSRNAHFGDALRLRDDQILDYVAAGLVDGRFQMGRRPVTYVSGPSTLKEEEDKEEPPLVAMAPPEEVTWIQIEVLDENDRPLVDEPYRLEPPDGSDPIEGKLDAKGRARHEKIVAGNYRLIFPDRDEAWWKPKKDDLPPKVIPPAEVLEVDLPEVGWIDIELIDDAGRPVPHETFRIEPSDGSEPVEGELDAEGRATVDGFEPGDCQVVFPMRDSLWWESKVEDLEVKAAPAAEVEEVSLPELSWLEFQLLDGWGNPLRGERFEVELPDGEIREGELDEEGIGRIDDTPPGECVVRLPDIDAKDWELPEPEGPPPVSTQGGS